MPARKYEGEPNERLRIAIAIYNLKQQSRRLRKEEKGWLPLEETVSTPSCEEEVERNIIAQQLHQLLEQFPDQQRTALILRDAEKQPYTEISLQLGISVKEAKSLVTRAERALRNGKAWWFVRTALR